MAAVRAEDDVFSGQVQDVSVSEKAWTRRAWAGC
jgi:hypothetical protein